MRKEYYLYVNGEKVNVTEEVYKGYWQITNHQNYLERVDRKNNLLFFSNLNHDGNYIDNLVDESIDVEKIYEAKMLIKDLKHALCELNEKELEIVRDIYFNEMTLSEIAKRRNCHASSVMKMRNKVLKKLRKIMEEK